MEPWGAGADDSPCIAWQRERRARLSLAATSAAAAAAQTEYPWRTHAGGWRGGGDPADTAVIIIAAIICSGVFVLAVIRQNHNIFSP